VREAVGSVRFEYLGGLARRTPVLSVGFFLGALTLIGIPPLSGFFGKLLVFQTAADAGAVGGQGATLALALALGGAILTVAYFSRAWNEGFWGTQSEAVRTATYSPTLVAVVVALAAALVVVGVGFDPVLRAANAAANAAVDRGTYVENVLPGVSP